MDASLPKKHRPIEEITVISFEDERYPPLLRHAFQPPKQLYVRGNVDALVHDYPVAFVGTRKATLYGQTAARMLVGPIARAGVCVVSGLAFGIDAACHESALEVGGLTVAVLAGGVDDESIAPPRHLGLARRILAQGGALVSEYPPGKPAMPYGFPARNRIIAGMTMATVVVESALKSGASITVRLAGEINREVFAVPGNITSPTAEGPNKWINDGAHPLITPNDLLQNIGLVRINPARPSDQREAAVLESVMASPKTPEQISEETFLELHVVMAATTALTLKNLITEHRGVFIKN